MEQKWPFYKVLYPARKYTLYCVGMSLLYEKTLLTQIAVEGFAQISSIPSPSSCHVLQHLMQHINNLYIWHRRRLGKSLIPIFNARNEYFGNVSSSFSSRKITFSNEMWLQISLFIVRMDSKRKTRIRQFNLTIAATTFDINFRSETPITDQNSRPKVSVSVT